MKNPFETGVPTRHLIYTIATDVATSSTWRIVENKLWGMTLSKFRESESFSSYQEVRPIVRDSVLDGIKLHEQ